jgi:hypothetical protein
MYHYGLFFTWRKIKRIGVFFFKSYHLIEGNIKRPRRANQVTYMYATTIRMVSHTPSLISILVVVFSRL